MFGNDLLLIIKGIKKTIFFILKILIKIGNVRERIFIYHKKYKKKIFYILKILIKIGNVWVRTLINQERYKKDYILHLVNKNKNHKFSGKNFYLLKSIKKTIFNILKIVKKIGNVRVRTLISH